MPFLVAGPDITPITELITTWTHIAQALVASIGALAFIFALVYATKRQQNSIGRAFLRRSGGAYIANAL